MSALATRIETQVGRALTPGEIFEITRARETSLSRLLMLYITTGLAFMLLPGTFLGVPRLANWADVSDVALLSYDPSSKCPSAITGIFLPSRNIVRVARAPDPSHSVESAVCALDNLRVRDEFGPPSPITVSM